MSHLLQTKRLRLVVIVAALVLASIPTALAADEVKADPPPDPATSTDHPCYYIQNWVWDYPSDGVGAVRGKVRFPSSSCQAADGPPNERPVLIFAHGNGMTHTDHDYLMAHLARNGFVTASIENWGSNEERAKRMISFLNSLHAFWAWNTRLSNDVAFAGHSRGGEAAVTAARLLGDTPALGAEPYDVRAVLPIAPTDGGGGGSPDPRESLTAKAADGFLAIYGAKDADVTGQTGNPSKPQRTAFAIYDRAGSESSVEGWFLWWRMDKAMEFVYDMGHRDFLDQDQLGATPDGRDTAKAYFTAFLRWKVLGEAGYRSYIDGSAKPESLADVTLFQQFSPGTRRVVDNFENGNLAMNALGGSVTASAGGIITRKEGELYKLGVQSSPHDTGGLRLTWAAPSWTRWIIPDKQGGPGVGRLRDVSDYTHLSVRVAQVYKNSYNTPGEDQNFHIRLHTGAGAGAGFSNAVPVNDYGRAPYPQQFLCPAYVGNCGWLGGDYTKSAMTTIRVPLSAFGNADLTDVRSIVLETGIPERPKGAITLDSLEFVR